MAGSERYWKKPKTPHSHLKSKLVIDYFGIWASILAQKAERIAYLDLFAGKAMHKSGEYSTGIEVLYTAKKNQMIREKIRLIFNDVKVRNCRNLEEFLIKNELGRHFDVKPVVRNLKIDKLIAGKLAKVRMIPTFCFIDPYGYRGLSINLVQAVLKDYGSDAFIFFYTSGINRNILRKDAQDDMIALFGEKRYKEIIKRITTVKQSREDYLLQQFRQAVNSVGAQYFIALQVNFHNSRRISHHLVFLSKHRLGFNRMKNVMYKYSVREDGIPRYLYVEGCENPGDQQNVSFVGPMSELKQFLKEKYAGRKVLVEHIVEELDKLRLNYVDRNIQDALMLLENDGVVEVTADSGRRRVKGKMGLQQVVNFSRRH
jgi:three-Cys-motif partner protein